MIFAYCQSSELEFSLYHTSPRFIPGWKSRFPWNCQVAGIIPQYSVDFPWSKQIKQQSLGLKNVVSNSFFIIDIIYFTF